MSKFEIVRPESDVMYWIFRFVRFGEAFDLLETPSYIEAAQL
jgi:hypothetical protein